MHNSEVRKLFGVFALICALALIMAPASLAAGTITVNNGVVCVTGVQADPYAAIYCTIGDAVADSAAGDAINVAAGTYAEDLIIDKAVTLLGPNAAINPNTGTRVAEALILPAFSAPDPSVCEVMVDIKVSDFTVKGFTFDGDNPALASGVMIDGADVDACEILAGDDGMGNIVVENNILKHATYSAIDFYNYYNSAATAGNYIRFNRIEDIGETTYNWGLGILIYNNFYAEITDNVLTGVRTGIQTGNFFAANPGTTGSISNNQIGVWRLGIFHNLAYSSASPLTISGNTITAETYPGANKWNGLLLSSIGDPVNAIITNNTITIPGAVSFPVPGYTAGYNVWNVTTTAPIAISGGTVTGGDYGVFVNNYEGYSSNANSTAIKVDGVTVLDSKIAGVYVKDSPSNTNGATVYANIQNATIDTAGTGILVEGEDATAKANQNNLDSNPTKGLTNTNSVATVDAENNWWGTVCEPSAKVSGLVDYTPWWGDATGSFTLTANATAITVGDSAAKQMEVINCAAPGATITYPLGTYPGGIIVTANNVTIDLGGATVGHGTPAYTIVGDDITVQNGILDGVGDLDNAAGVLVQSDADNFTLNAVEVKNWRDGVEVAGSHASLKLVNNWLHDNSEDGFQFNSDVVLSGVITINGNLFKFNTLNGIQNDSTALVPAEYNSWGDFDGPAVGTGGDGITGNVDATPFSFVELFTDAAVTAKNVVEGDTFTVQVLADAAGLYAVQYKLTYDKTLLVLQTPVTNGAFGSCITDTATAGVITSHCNLLSPAADVNGMNQVVNTITFKVQPDSSHSGQDSWTTYLDLVHNSGLAAAARDGIKVWVNNAGFGASSSTDKDITDNQDGTISIAGLAQYTGYIDLQGRTNDSLAVLSVYNQFTVSGATLKATATSAASGAYLTAYVTGQQLSVGTIYYFQVDRDLYLPTTRTYTTAATDWADLKQLSDRPDTVLGTVILLGGDANNDNRIELSDATCIGNAYGGAATSCGAIPGNSTDVTGDGKVDILDLTLMGGNYEKYASPWVE